MTPYGNSRCATKVHRYWKEHYRNRLRKPVGHQPIVIGRIYLYITVSAVCIDIPTSKYNRREYMREWGCVSVDVGLCGLEAGCPVACLSGSNSNFLGGNKNYGLARGHRNDSVRTCTLTICSFDILAGQGDL